MMKNHLKISLIHFSSSLFVLFILFCLVYLVWYPGQFFKYLDVGNILFILLVVDVLSGPALGLMLLQNKRKRKKEKIFDFSVLLLVQCAFFAYGVITLLQGRPLIIGFEKDQFQMVQAKDLHGNLAQRWGYILKNVVNGPRVLDVYIADGTSKNYLSDIELSLRGIGPSHRMQNILQSRPFAANDDQAYDLLHNGFVIGQVKNNRITLQPGKY